VLGLAAALLSCLASCGGGAGELEAPPPVGGNPVAAFAPLVNLHEYEERWPLSAKSFLGYGTLTWRMTDPCSFDETIAIGRPLRPYRLDDAEEPTLDVSRLAGSRPYELRPLSDDCERRGATSYATTQRTRPFDRRRPAALRLGEGYYVDLWIERRGGEADFVVRNGQDHLRGTPAYFDRRPERIGGEPGLRITYWLLYGSNAPRTRPAGEDLAHEGDWERMSVLARRESGAGGYVPVSVRFHRDGRTVDVPWRSLDTTAGATGAATHPVVYAARGSHTLYPSAGVRSFRNAAGYRPVTIEDVAAACAECPEWSTWEALLPVRDQPWYGYAGAWGYPHDSITQAGPSPFLR
jgi:hypothetical protein